MAIYYPRKGNCLCCGGTGRAQQPNYPGKPVLIGDNTMMCSGCFGTGRTQEERAAEMQKLIESIDWEKLKDGK